MKQFGSLVFVLIVILAFAAGYWPQHKKLLQAQEQFAETSAKLSSSESTVHLCQLQGQLAALMQEAANKDYADASALSTKFFNGLRGEIENMPASRRKSSLESVLNQRDAVTAALATANPKAHDLLEKLLADLSKSVM